MATIGLLNAFASTVGDNLEHHLISQLVRDRAHRVLHLWDFKHQQPGLVKGCEGLVLGGGGVLWDGAPIRNEFFLNTIGLSSRACGISCGYNQGHALHHHWVDAVNHLEFLTTRDPWTSLWARDHTDTRVVDASSIGWIYTPPAGGRVPRYDLGVIYNHKAWEMNYGFEHILRLFPLLGGLKLLEIPFAQPIEQPLLPAVNNREKLAHVSCASIKQCRAVLTGRLHGFILALLCGVPAICVDDTFKVKAQATMCGYPLLRCVLALRHLDREGWLDLIKQAEGLDVDHYVGAMRLKAQKHEEELDKWLRTF